MHARSSLPALVVFAIALSVALALECKWLCAAEPPNTEKRVGTNSDRIIAIDVLLEPDATMVQRAMAANTKLRENYPQGYTLGPQHVPHITLVQRYVREKDLAAVGAAVSKVLTKENPLTWQLNA